MKINWLGQASYLLTAANGTRMLIDPYLSNSLEESNGPDMHRLVPIDEKVLNSKVDMVLLTHSHDDHLDFSTLDVIVKNNPRVKILCAYPTMMKCRTKYSSPWYMLMDEGCETTVDGIHFEAVHAAHCDGSVGFIIEADGKVVCHSGDGILHKRQYVEFPKYVDAFLVVINGKGNNMNAFDAAKLTKALQPKSVYPMHFDMFKPYAADVNEFKDYMKDTPTIKIVVPPYSTDVEL